MHLYIHVPFCNKICPYCAFYKHRLGNTDIRGYITAVIAEAKLRLPQGYRPTTIYFGGGTPSILGGEGLSLILSTIRKHFDVTNDAEITFEANPDSITDRLLRRLRSEGFNRVSLGIQTDNDELLAQLGRPHDYAQAVEAVRNIRRHGFKNLSVDLMYGLPGQTIQDWIHALANITKLDPEHISCYGLKLEPGTPLYRQASALDIPDDDLQADMYLSAISFLKDKGYRQYEISNFCKKGNISRHNKKYWTLGEYLGFGPGAYSDFGGQRFAIVRDLRRYIAGIQEHGQVLTDVEDVPFRERAGEYLMLQLRTVSGIDPKEYEKKYMLPFGPLEEKLEVFRSRKLAEKTYDGRWHLTGEGFLLSNDIISDLLAIQDNCKPIAKRKK